jgi:hypothetical protein
MSLLLLALEWWRRRESSSWSAPSVSSGGALAVAVERTGHQSLLKSRGKNAERR